MLQGKELLPGEELFQRSASGAEGMRERKDFFRARDRTERKDTEEGKRLFYRRLREE